MKSKVLFQESQKFQQWWLWIIVIGLVIVAASTFDYSEPLKNQLTVDKVILTITAVGILVLFLTLKLSTRITEEKIQMRYFPFVKKDFYWKDMTSAQVIDYGFVGGWGIRIWTSYGTVYNVGGSKGLHIKIADKQYVIGTQKEEELRSSIAHLLK
ncbi:hypothetical protein LX97_00284 [Nonlabens dokdonensis]|jgi:hypothetical protein|uniref:Uncharacterized protein n=2 Tax=Nonlabens dokdonensis TaxID=328515 RepID=L7W720_NONDD|nr:hypothetical protein [Nonlabens dokdonensis]AGC75591.1 hypothetical protein DDD_0464 [Nonlabens dokdonensis DSW-6]PZX43284.1 hypothetical protein LX97_00284 [Nonlabens dokdonensis]